VPIWPIWHGLLRSSGARNEWRPFLSLGLVLPGPFLTRPGPSGTSQKQRAWITNGRWTEDPSPQRQQVGRVGFPSIPAWFSPPLLMKSVDAEEGSCHCPLPESASVCRPSARCRLPLARVGRGDRSTQGKCVWARRWGRPRQVGEERSDSRSM
jgi:hypothetical protein